VGTTFPLQRKGERTRDTKFIQISLFVKGVSVELVVQHTTTKNIIYLTAPRWWLVHGWTRAPLHGCRGLHCTAQSESAVVSRQLAVNERGPTDSR